MHNAGYGRSNYDEPSSIPKPYAVPTQIVQRSNAMQNENEPNHILFVQNLPENVESQKLHMIFGRDQGFLEIRQVKNKGVAFIEFESEELAAKSKNRV